MLVAREPSSDPYQNGGGTSMLVGIKELLSHAFQQSTPAGPGEAQ